MSKSTDRRRHEALAKATASWRSWVADRWFCNGFMAVEVDEPFRSGPMQLDFECMCSTFEKHQHRNTLNRLCVFADSYEPNGEMLAKISAVLLKVKGDGRASRIDIEDDVLESKNEPGLEAYRARIDQDPAERAWVGVNKRYVDAVREYARPTHWYLTGLAGAPVGIELSVAEHAPAVIAVRGERMVGAVMVMGIPGSAIEIREVSVEA